jgi:hypothetical protein
MKDRNTYRLVPRLIFSTILLWSLFPGCNKESPLPEEKELEPKVELTVTPEGVIPYGGNIDVRWTADQNTNKVVAKVNGLVKNTSQGSASRAGALVLGPLFKDLLVSVTATNIDLSTEVEKEVHVGDWTTSTFGLVSYYPWRYDSLGRSSLDGKVLKRWKADPELSSFVDYYHKDGTVTYSNYPGLKISWFLPDDNSITINGATRKLQVNQEQMIISYQGTYDGETVWFDMIYEHASDTPTDPE